MGEGQVEGSQRFLFMFFVPLGSMQKEQDRFGKHKYDARVALNVEPGFIISIDAAGNEVGIGSLRLLSQFNGKAFRPVTWLVQLYFDPLSVLSRSELKDAAAIVGDGDAQVVMEHCRHEVLKGNAVLIRMKAFTVRILRL